MAEIDVKCQGCGNWLETEWVNCGPADPTLEVSPCETCLEKAKEEAPDGEG